MIKNMKKGLFLLLSMTFSYLGLAQVPNSFSYQMVIRNGNNELVANTTVGIRIGLLGGNAADTVWYEEEHKVKTNLNVGPKTKRDVPKRSKRYFRYRQRLLLRTHLSKFWKPCATGCCESKRKTSM